MLYTRIAQFHRNTWGSGCEEDQDPETPSREMVFNYELANYYGKTFVLNEPLKVFDGYMERIFNPGDMFVVMTYNLRQGYLRINVNGVFYDLWASHVAWPIKFR